MTFINEWNADGTGWARFSEDRRMRYRLRRVLVERATMGDPRVVFIMLNPSTADAFKNDPTITRCCEFALRWGAKVLEVVNLFALRTPHPTELRAAYAAGGLGACGGDSVNDDQILAACLGGRPHHQVLRVVTAWGAHGRLANQSYAVEALLHERGIKQWALGFTRNGDPLHPLARGKSFVPYDRKLICLEDEKQRAIASVFGGPHPP